MRHRLFLALVSLSVLAIVAVGASSRTPSSASQQVPPAPALPQGYAGTDTCTACHDQGQKWKGTPHARVGNPRTPAAAQGCESCHGPGQAHVDDDAKGHILKFSKVTAAEVNRTCLTCHNRGDHAAWEGSAHERRNLSCATCHSVHSPKSFERQLVKTTQTEVCATCHRPQVAKTERAVAHMPVREGKMACSSCHNPHGSIGNVKALKTGSSVAELCVTCHAEMRGPVLWEHAPVRESCTTCHDAHGSSNDRMLAVRMPFLCQRCHVATRHPVEHLRQQCHHHEQEQPDVRAIVHELPPEHPRIQPSVWPVLHAIAVGGSHMRGDTRRRLACWLWLMIPTLAYSQTPQDPAVPPPAPTALADVEHSLFEPTWRQFQFGARATSIDGDPARFQRYQDERDGVLFTDFRFAREDAAERWLFRATADNLGWRDHRYTAHYEQPGRLVVSGGLGWHSTVLQRRYEDAVHARGRPAGARRCDAARGFRTARRRWMPMYRGPPASISGSGARLAT